MQLVQQIDPYNHLRSIHNCMAFYDHTKPWITHCSIQSQSLHRVPLWMKKYGKPIVIDECGYEGVAEGRWNVEAGGYCVNDYFLFYFGMRQPSSRNFNLPTGSFRIDVIDTWNMTIEPVAESAGGEFTVALPGRKYMAIRIVRNQD
jgi:hypothetical protein